MNHTTSSINPFDSNAFDKCIIYIARKIMVMRLILIYIAHQQNICLKFVSFLLYEILGT